MNITRNPMLVQFWLWGLDAIAGDLSARGFQKLERPNGSDSSVYRLENLHLHGHGLWLETQENVLIYRRPSKAWYALPKSATLCVGHFKGDTLAWHDGPVMRAMKEGARLVLNEISHASDDALAFLYPVLEHSETARLTLPTGETVTPAPGFHVVVTDNLPPDGLPAALQDRFDATLEISEPHPSALARLSDGLREVARRSFALDDERRLSVRRWLTLDRVRHELGLEDACLVVFGAERGSQVFDALVIAGVR